MSNKDRTRHKHFYERIDCEMQVEDNGLCWLYGVCCKSGQGEALLAIVDVSSDIQVVDRLVDLLNEHEVSSIHAKEVVEDFIALL